MSWCSKLIGAVRTPDTAGDCYSIFESSQSKHCLSHQMAVASRFPIMSYSPRDFSNVAHTLYCLRLLDGKFVG
jgi:hypothetical protein